MQYTNADTAGLFRVEQPRRAPIEAEREWGLRQAERWTRRGQPLKTSRLQIVRLVTVSASSRRTILAVATAATICVGASFLGAWGASAKALVAAFVVWRARSYTLPVLAVLWFEPRALETNWESVQLLKETTPDSRAGIGLLTVPIATALAVALRVAWWAVRREKTTPESRATSILLSAWCGLGLLATVSSVRGFELQLPNWTQPTRMVLALAGFFYAQVLAERGGIGRSALSTIQYCGLAYVIAAAGGVYWDHIVFFFAPLCVGLAVHNALRRRLLPSLGYVAPSVAFILVGADTLTKLASCLATALIAIALWADESPSRPCGANRKATRQWDRSTDIGYSCPKGSIHGLWKPPSKAGKYGSTPAWRARGLLFALATATLCFPPWVLSHEDVRTGPWNGSAVTIEERVTAKAFDDRGILWRAAWETIAATDQWLPAAGHPLRLRLSPASAMMEWEIHCHNAWLEAARAAGVLFGVLFLLTAASMWWKAGRGLTTISDERKPIVVASLATSAVGCCTGLFPVDFAAGFWIWIFIGMAARAGFSAVRPRVPAGARSRASKDEFRAGREGHRCE